MRLKRKALVMLCLFEPLDPLCKWAVAFFIFFSGVCQRHIDPAEPQSLLTALSAPTDWPRKRERTDRWVDGSGERLISIKLQCNIAPRPQGRLLNSQRLLSAETHVLIERVFGC